MISPAVAIETFSATYVIKMLLDTVFNFSKERISLLLALEDEIKKLKHELETIYSILNYAVEKQVSERPMLKWLHDLKDFAYDVEDIFDEFEKEITMNSAVECSDDATVTKRGRVLHAAIGNERAKSLRRCKKILGNCFCLGSSFASSSKPSPITTRLNIADRIKELMETFDDLIESRKKLDLMVPANFPKSEQEKRRISKRPPTTSTIVAQYEMIGRENEKNILIDKLLGDKKESKLSGVSILSVIGMGGVGKSTLAKVIYNDPIVAEHFKYRKWVSVGENFEPRNLIEQLIDEDTNQSNKDISLQDLHEKLKSKCKGWQKFLIVLDDVWNQDALKWEEIWVPLSHGIMGSTILMTSRSQRAVEVTLQKPTILLEGLDDDSCFSILMKHAFPNGDFKLLPNLVNVGKEIIQQLGGLPLAAKVVGGALFNKLDERYWRRFLNDKPWEVKDNEDAIMGSLRWSYNLLPADLKQCFGYCSLLCKDQNFEKEDLVSKWIAVGLIQSKETTELEDIGDDYFNYLLQLSFFELSGIRKREESYVMHDLIHDLAQSVSSYDCKNLGEKLYKSSKINENVRHLLIDSDYNIEMLQNYKKVRTLIFEQHSKIKYANDILLKLKYIRVLEITCYHKEDEAFPISQLKHLRYLKVPHSRALPETISDVYNLQCLLMHGDRSVHFKNLSKLVNLRRLDGFRIGTESGYKIEELGRLQELRGSFLIEMLKNVKDKEEALSGNIKNKKHLKKLYYDWGRYELLDRCHQDEEVIEGLEPNQDLEELVIFLYGGLQFPRWLSDASILCCLRALTLDNCWAIKSAPALGQLPCLKRLELVRMYKLSTICEEFYGLCNENKPPFIALEKLKLSFLDEWKDWFAEGWHFPSIRILVIEYCENLSIVPPILSGTMRKLVFHCVNIVDIPCLGSLTNLQHLRIVDCPGLSKAILGLINVTRTTADAAPLVPILPLLKVLRISDMSLFYEVFHSAGVFCSTSSLEEIELRYSDDTGENHWGTDQEVDCESDQSNKMNHWGPQLQQFTSLRRMSRVQCNELLYLPPHLHQLPSLIILEIDQCNKIKALPSRGLPKSLQYLRINCEEACPLKGRCEDTRLDWPKISHVPHINV